MCRSAEILWRPQRKFASLTAHQPKRGSLPASQSQKGKPMSQQMFALSFGLAAVLAATQIAHSAPQCDSREAVTALLADRYNETRRSVGIAGQSAVMELFAAEDTGTWSITMTLPDGQMCLMASGSNYETLAEELPAKGDPA
jgi:hypothetical protein